MKKVLFSVLALVACCTTVCAQSIIDADDQRKPNEFYQKGIVVGKKAMPYPAVRESDVIWECVVWRSIDLREKFNQFFYFPVDEDKNTQGRTNLVNLIVHGVENGEIPAYEDDDFKKELDPAEAMKFLIGNDVSYEDVATDEDGNVLYDEDGVEIMTMQNKTRTFNKESANKILLQERWYIDKQDSRQKVRIVGLAFMYMKEMGDTKESLRDVYTESFWIPMDDMRVRQLLVNANAYDENNDVVERSYDDIFIQRYFDSYITRQSNVQNRALSEYLTGEDAILQSQAIEDYIFDLESDMWEY